MLGIFRSLGRPQDAERFFGLGFFPPFPPYIVGMFSSLPLAVLFLYPWHHLLPFGTQSALASVTGSLWLPRA